MRKAFLVFVIAAVLALTLSGTALAVSPYPLPAPDFSHAGSPHDGLYSPYGGDTDRPMLIIYRQFTDFPAAAGRDAAWASQQFFGPGFPNAADYFDQSSFGDLILSAATETQGTANDGIVMVTANTGAEFWAMSEGDRNLTAVQAADPFVNFASFDTNSDGNITDDELVVVQMHMNTAPDQIGGATRGVSAGTLDGKNIAFSVALGTPITNLMTNIHEIAHVAIHMRDLYGFGVGSLDISGPTISSNMNLYFNTNAWQKMHVGWITPTVVREDGYYLVNDAYTNPQAFILYDYAHGTDDYFIVENRRRMVGTYEQTASDTGLVIWRADDAQYGSGDDTVRPIDIMRPDGTTNAGCDAGGCYGGSNGDGWDPSDSTTPQRTMTRTWRDGTASNVAVRAIGRSGATIRAYFDVRGPGVLVDATTATGNPQLVEVTPEEANPVGFTVMNTGEAADTFAFTITGLPAGWTATTDTRTLGAGVGATANVSVTVPADAAVGEYTVNAVGTSIADPSIITTSRLTLKVVLHQTGITYTGDTSEPWGEPAGFAAQLFDITDPTEIVDGASVTFALSDGTNSQSVTVTSDSTGLATANPAVAVPPGTYTLTVSMTRHGKHAAATKSTTYVVEKRPTSIDYTGDLGAEYSDPAAVSAALTDGLNGDPLAGKTVDFALGTQNASAATDGTGTASTAIVLTQPAADVTVSATFSEDSLYLGSSDNDTFTIDEEDLAFVYTGDTLVGLGTTPTLAAQATQEADGYPGDLSLAQARFDLIPTLTVTPFDYTTGVSGAGAAGIVATGLPVDLWSIMVTVPAGNGYWEGSTAAPTELVLFDPARAFTAGVRATDTAGDRTGLQGNGDYKNMMPRGELRFESRYGRFVSGPFHWIVVVGDQALFQLEGTLAGGTRVLRVRARDAGEPAAGADTYRAMLRMPAGPWYYDSGMSAVTNGNLQTR